MYTLPNIMNERDLFSIPKFRPFRSRKYLAWIRLRPCIVKGCKEKSEASHVGAHGLATKADDTRALPMCQGHHRTRGDSWHAIGREAFENLFALDISEQVICHVTRWIAEETQIGDEHAA